MRDFKLTGNNFDSVEEDISILKELFPSIVTGDNEIDFDELREIFEKNGETVVDDSEEFYKFTWWGKKNAMKVAKESTTKTLRPSLNDSKNWDSTENIYIEGDNLDALKILLGPYRNSIKMIYIDPPYNTGKDFVYNDNFIESNEEYLERTEQVSDEGYLFENARSNGKFHSNWLNMIYPRLILARKLLTDDGVIFISIDDHEIENLKKICNEIFGEENFIATIIWERAYSPVNLKKHISESHDYALCFSKNITKCICNGLRRDDDANDRYQNWDNDPRGPWKSSDLSVGPIVEEKVYEITTPSGRKVLPPEGYCWRLTKSRFEEYVQDNRIWFGHDGNNVPSIKRFLSEVKDTITPMSIWKYKDVGHSQSAKQKLIKLFDGKSYFDYPKPVDLIKRMIELYSNSDDIILDFFSGSATTAHAVMKFNSEICGSNRKFIMVQIPEETSERSNAYKDGYKNICDIGKERIRRAGDKIIKESNNKDLDIGFKVFKVDESNFIPWNPLIESENDAKQAILTTGNNIVDGRSELDLIYELLLKLNMELTCSIEEENVNNHKIYVIDDGYALICLDSNIDESITNDLIQLKEDLMTEHCEVILRDDALDDNLAINIYETLKTNNMEFHTI